MDVVVNQLTCHEGAVADAKCRAINEYNDFVKRLKKGYQDDYTHLMNLINWISLCKTLPTDRKIYEFLINHAV